MGSALAAIGLACSPTSGSTPTTSAHLLPAELMVSLGMGTAFVPLRAPRHRVDRRDAGVASAMVNTTQQTGGSLGVALLNTVAASATTGTWRPGATAAGRHGGRHGARLHHRLRDERGHARRRGGRSCRCCSWRADTRTDLTAELEVDVVAADDARLSVPVAAPSASLTTAFTAGVGSIVTRSGHAAARDKRRR